MDEKQKAKELVEKYKPIVNGYVGSSMLTNTEYTETILANAKQCALIAVDEILKLLWLTHKNEAEYRYWQEVKNEILNL
jgi:hypothetical protein